MSGPSASPPRLAAVAKGPARTSSKSARAALAAAVTTPVASPDISRPTTSSNTPWANTNATVLTAAAPSAARRTGRLPARSDTGPNIASAPTVPAA